jgi:hypothetical protein
MDAPSMSSGNELNLLSLNDKYSKLIKLQISSHSFAYKWMDAHSVSSGNELIFLLFNFNIVSYKL